MKIIVLSLALALASAAFADEYTPVDWIKVIEGGGIEIDVPEKRVHMGAAPGAGCIVMGGSINNVSMRGNTKWQMRGEDSEWVDVPGTERDRAICGNLLPDMPGEFRWVAEIGIDGVFKKYASGNTLVIAGDSEVEDETADEEAENETTVEAVSWGFLKSRAAP